MRRDRLISLTVGHALAADAPLGPALRALGLTEAAALADAGVLHEALRIAGLRGSLGELAGVFPAAVLPAARRLGLLPGVLGFQGPLLQLLVYLGCGILGLRLGQRLLHAQVLPALAEMTAQPPDDIASLSTLAVLAAAVIGVPVVGALLLSLAGSPRLPGWGRALRVAREAALAAALWESGAPATLRNRLSATFLDPEVAGRDAADADRRAAAALGLARHNHARFVSAMRIAGLGALTLYAFATLAEIYGLLAQLPVSL
jgi:hypothetical protein